MTHSVGGGRQFKAVANLPHFLLVRNYKKTVLKRASEKKVKFEEEYRLSQYKHKYLPWGVF